MDVRDVTAPVEALHTKPLRRCASAAISDANALIQCHNPKNGSSQGAGLRHALIRKRHTSEGWHCAVVLRPIKANIARR
jgi:hypothetical protein